MTASRVMAPLVPFWDLTSFVLSCLLTGAYIVAGTMVLRAAARGRRDAHRGWAGVFVAGQVLYAVYLGHRFVRMFVDALSRQSDAAAIGWTLLLDLSILADLLSAILLVARLRGDPHFLHDPNGRPSSAGSREGGMMG